MIQNGLADWNQIWCMIRDQVLMHITQVMRVIYRTCARVYELFLYLGNSWTDCTEIRCVVRDQLSKHFAKIKSGVHAYAIAHAHVCTLFHISETTGRIVPKFGVWLETH